MDTVREVRWCTWELAVFSILPTCSSLMWRILLYADKGCSLSTKVHHLVLFGCEVWEQKRKARLIWGQVLNETHHCVRWRQEAYSSPRKNVMFVLEAAGPCLGSCRCYMQVIQSVVSPVALLEKKFKIQKTLSDTNILAIYESGPTGLSLVTADKKDTNNLRRVCCSNHHSYSKHHLWQEDWTNYLVFVKIRRKERKLRTSLINKC